jgi:flagellar basal-body rod protein FlgB
MRTDGNNVDIEKEVAALVENNLYYSGVATGLSNKFKLLQSVLQGGRQ